MLRKVPFAIAAPQRLDSRLSIDVTLLPQSGGGPYGSRMRRSLLWLSSPSPPALVSTCLNPAWLPSVVYPIHSHGSVFPIANLPRPWRVTLTSRDNGEAEFARGQHVQGGGR